MPVSNDDLNAITDMFGRYCWLVDEGDADGWVALFTEDCEVTGLYPQTLKGREQIRAIPENTYKATQGKLRHLAANMCCDYGERPDVVHAKYYNLVTDWSDGGKFRCLALSKVVLVRSGAGWLIQRSDSEMFLG